MMPALLQSLAELTNTPLAQFLVDAAAKATVLLAAAMVAASLLRRSSAAVRHRIWCLTFAALVLLPGLSALLPEWRLAVLPYGRALEYSSPLAPREESRSPLARQAEAALTSQPTVPIGDDLARDSLPLAEREGDFTPASNLVTEGPPPVAIASAPARLQLATCWLIGTLIALAPLVIGFARTLVLHGRSRAIDDALWTGLLDDLRQRLTLARRVGLYETASALMPMTWGVLRPVVMLPRQARDWTDRLRRIVLLHELAHVKRYDVGFQLLGRLACALYWFHPLAWYGLRRLRIERELACDDCVVLAGERATDYAAELLQIARSYRSFPFAAAVAMAQRNNLEHRLRAMFDRACSHLPISRRVATLLLAAVLVVATTVAAVRLVPRAAAGEQATTEAKDDDDRSQPSSAIETRHRLHGRAIDDKGQPIVGARVRIYRNYWSSTGGGAAAPDPQMLADTRSDANGRFSAEFEPLSAAAKSQTKLRGFSESIGVFATAEGFGFGLSHVEPAASKKVDLRLVRDSSPIDGRVLDLEGRPVPGVQVTVRAVAILDDEPQRLDDWLAEIRASAAAQQPGDTLPNGAMIQEFDSFLHPFPAPTTDEDGRFTIAGIGADRVACLEIEGPRIATSWLPVVTRPIGPLPLPSGILRRGVVHDRFATQTCYGARCEIVAVPEQPIRGAVRDAETGQPLEGAEVRLDWNDTFFAETGLSAKTDAKGRYQLSGLPKPTGDEQEVELRVIPAAGHPYFRTEVRVPRGKGLDAVTCDVPLRRAVTLRGQVTDRKTGEPVGAAVRYYPFLTNPEARQYPNFEPGVHKVGDDDRYLTDADGKFVIPAVTGRGVLTVAADRGDRYSLADGAKAIRDLLLPGQRQLNVYHLSSLQQDNAVREVDIPANAEDFTLNVELAPLPITRLLLADSDGKELTGVETQGLAPRKPFADHWMNGWREPLSTAWADLLGPEAGETRETLFLDRVHNLGAMVRFTPDSIHGEQPKRIVLQPCGSVRGRILDGGGRGVAGAHVDATVVPGEGVLEQDGDSPVSSTRRFAWRLKLNLVHADAEGRFELKGIPPGARYAVEAFAEKRAEKWRALTAEIKPGVIVELGDVAPHAQQPAGKQQSAGQATIHGRVIDLEGRPVVGARVHVENVWAADDKAKLDGWLADVRAAHDALNFQQAEYKHLRKLPRPDDNGGLAAVLTDSGGRFQIDAGGEDRVLELQVIAERIESLFCRAVTRPIEPLRVPSHIREVADGLVNPEDDKLVFGSSFEHAAAPGCRVEGLVRDEQTGKPLPNITVRAQHGLDPLASATTDANGHYVLTGVPGAAKPAQVVALAANDVPYLGKTLNVTLARPGDRAKVDFELGRGVWIEGQVIDKLTGRGVEAAVEYYARRDNRYLERVGTWGVPRVENVRVYTDKGGKFRLLGLPGLGLLSAAAGGGYARGVGSELVPGVKNGRSNMTQPNITPESVNAIVKVDVPEQAEAFPCQIELDRGRERTGKVLGPDGEPLEGVHFVLGWKEDHWFGDKPLDGPQFTVEELVPGRSRTLVFVHEARKLIGTIEASGDGDEPLEVRLQPWASVHGRVVDDEGTPRSNLIVVSSDFRHQEKPGRDGKFAFDRLVPGVKYTFGSKFGEAVTAWQVREVVLEPGENRDVGEVVVEKPR